MTDHKQPGQKDEDSAGIPIRQLIRQTANKFMAEHELPSNEKIRKRIQHESGGKRNPSATTVQDEMVLWYEDTFWATFSALGSIREHPGVPDALRRIYDEGFRSLVIGSIDAAGAAWNDERNALRAEVREREAEAQEIRSRLESALQTTAAMEREIQRGEEESIRLQQDRQTLNATIVQLRTEVSTSQALLREAAERALDYERKIGEVREHERLRADQQIGAARDDLRKVQLELDAERQAVRRHETSADRLQAEIKSLQSTLAKSEAARVARETELQTAHDLHRKEIARVTESLERLSAGTEPPRRPGLPATRERPLRQRLRKNTTR